MHMGWPGQTLLQPLVAVLKPHPHDKELALMGYVIARNDVHFVIVINYPVQLLENNVLF